MKYTLTDETKRVDYRILYRIECVEAFGDVKVGDKGGWIEKEENLSQKGNCWVRDNACVYEDACVCGNALVYEDAKVCGDASVLDNAKVFGNARIIGGTKVCGNAQVFDNAQVFGNAQIYGNAKVYGNAKIYGNAWVYDDSHVYGDAHVYGFVQISGDSKIESNKDYLVFKNTWSYAINFTWTRSNDMWKVGYFYGTGEELIKKAYAQSESCGQHYEATVKYVEQLKAMEE